MKRKARRRDRPLLATKGMYGVHTQRRSVAAFLDDRDFIAASSFVPGFFV
jgi:hypothetical protein